jgi:hypothetical protein
MVKINIVNNLQIFLIDESTGRPCVTQAVGGIGFVTSLFTTFLNFMNIYVT